MIHRFYKLSLHLLRVVSIGSVDVVVQSYQIRCQIVSDPDEMLI